MIEKNEENNYFEQFKPHLLTVLGRKTEAE